jgi:hypothetical protein
MSGFPDVEKHTPMSSYNAAEQPHTRKDVGFVHLSREGRRTGGQYSLKLTSTLISTATGCPSLVAGSKRQR